MNSLEIYPRHHLVRLFGAPVKLTPMEFDILLLLARRPGQVFTARQIYEAVAADSFDASWTGTPAWSTSSAASWGLTSSKQYGATATE